MKQKLSQLVFEQRTIGERISLLLPSCLFFAFSLCFFTPLDMMYSNSADFWFDPGMAWGSFALLAFAVFALLTGAGLLLRGRLFNLYLSLLAGAALCLYLQGSFLNRSYGLLDGQMVQWERYASYSLTNTALALLLVFLPLILLYFSEKAWKAALRFAPSVLTLALAVTLGVSALTAQKPERDDFGFTYDGALSFSQDENALWIISDWFDNDFVELLQREMPDAFDTWDGFTYYPDTAGVSAMTFPSVTEMLTSSIYTGDIHFNEYCKQTWESESLFSIADDMGYDVRVLAGDMFCFSPSTGRFIRNMVPVEREITSKTRMLSVMMRLTAYRCLPHALKPGFWVDASELNSFRHITSTYHASDSSFYLHLQEQPISGDFAGKTLRFWHLSGMHPGNWMNRDIIATDTDEVWPVEQVQACAKVLSQILAQLKDAGVYDNTAIVIAADHGCTVWDPSMRTDYYSTDYTPIPNNPILFYKPAHARGPLQISGAPAWLMDIAPTLLDAMGGKAQLRYGTPLPRLQAGVPRTRYFYTNEIYIDGRRPDRVLTWRIEGNANDMTSWRLSED